MQDGLLASDHSGGGTQLPFKSYAEELPCNEEFTKHYRHVWCRDQNGGELARNPPIVNAGQPLTVPQCLDNAAAKYGNLQCMGTRQVITVDDTGRTRSGAKKILWHKAPEYTWETYAAVHAKVQAAAKGLVSLPGVLDAANAKKAAGSEYVVALLAETSAEWQISAQAAFAAGLTITTVYATLGHEAMLHGLRQTEAEVIFVEFDLYASLKDTVLAACPCLKHVVLIGKALVAEGRFPQPGQVPDSHQTLDSLVQLGNTTASSIDLVPMRPKETDLALIMYTSGSTGVPKGVELTHLNFISVIASAIAQGVVNPNPNDCIIAYLPLAHILELMCEMACMMQGSRIAYASPRTLTPASVYNPPDAITDLGAARPTLMAAVPAILEIIRTGLINKVEGMGGVKKKLICAAIARAKNKLYDGEPGYDSEVAGMPMAGCLDGVLIGKLKQAFGLENCRILISGGAPLSAETQRFCTAVFCPVAQGYGATETCGCATVQEVVSSDGSREQDRSVGRVGSIQPCSEIRLVSVPEMGYLVTDSPPRGEVLIAGNNVCRGYYKMPEKTAEDFRPHEDGKIYFHTGDIGVVHFDGVLQIVDRKKDLIKLEGGEYVSLGMVESKLKAVRGIGQCVVFARSDKKHCVCIVSQPEKGWASLGCDGPPSREELLGLIPGSLRKQGVARHEIPQDLRVDDAIWTPESGLVTASLKVARNPLRDHYNHTLLREMDYMFPTK